MNSIKKKGRPSYYKKEFADQAYKLCLLGLTDKQLGIFFDVNESTINRWKKAHPEFCKSLTRGKIISDAEVAEAFRKKAIGYQFQEVHKEFVTVDGEEPGELRISKIITKEVPPDARACLNWLKNRQREHWSDRIEQEITLPDKTPQEMTDAELDAAIRECAKQKQL